jgi:hypothetical protein
VHDADKIRENKLRRMADRQGDMRAVPRRHRVEAIYVGDRLRALDDQAVERLAASMKEMGLQTPISVRIVEGRTIIGGEEVRNVPHLVVGRHRLEAARQLGWEEIDCFLYKGDDIDAQLWEIDENLARAELTTDQKREHLRRRKQLWEQQRQAEIQVGHDVPPETGYRKPPPQTKGFAAATAAATGLSKRQINRLLAEPKVESRTEDSNSRPRRARDEVIRPLIDQAKVARLCEAFREAGHIVEVPFGSGITAPRSSQRGASHIHGTSLTPDQASEARRTALTSGPVEASKTIASPEVSRPTLPADPVEAAKTIIECFSDEEIAVIVRTLTGTCAAPWRRAPARAKDRA